MPSWIICLLLSVGAGAWIYAWFARHMGGANSRSALTAAIISSVFIFLVSYSLVSLFD